MGSGAESPQTKEWLCLESKGLKARANVHLRLTVYKFSSFVYGPPMAIDIQISRKYPTFYDKGTPNCATVDPELFFPEKGGGQGREFKMARSVCNRCDLTEMCLDWAIKHHEVGIWGGTSERERRVLRRERGIRDEIAS